MAFSDENCLSCAPVYATSSNSITIPWHQHNSVPGSNLFIHRPGLSQYCPISLLSTCTSWHKHKWCSWQQLLITATLAQSATVENGLKLRGLANILKRRTLLSGGPFDVECFVTLFPGGDNAFKREIPPAKYRST